jgi:hypothetical protein
LTEIKKREDVVGARSYYGPAGTRVRKLRTDDSNKISQDKNKQGTAEIHIFGMMVNSLAK